MIRNIDESFNKCVREEVIPNIAKAFGYLEGEGNMADFNNTAMIILAKMTEEEKEKALSILKSLDGLEVESAGWILDFCKASIKTKAVVKV